MRSFLRTCLIAFAAIFLATGANAADWNRVQGVLVTVGTGTTQSATFPAAVTSGNIVLCAWLPGNDNTLNGVSGYHITSMTDNGSGGSNTYREVTAGYDQGFSGASIVAARSLHRITNAPTTISVTFSSNAPSQIWMLCEEFVPPTTPPTTDISLSGVTYTTADAGITLPNMQVLDNDALVWMVTFSSVSTITTGTGFTAGMGASTPQVSQWKIQATASNAVTMAFGGSSAGTQWTVGIAIAPHAQTNWECVQNRMQRTTTTGTTGSVAFANAVPVGDVIFGMLASSDANFNNLTSLADNLSNTYTRIPGTLGVTGTQARQIFWSGGKLTNSPTTITATYSTAQTINFLSVVDCNPPPGTTSVVIDGTPVNANNTSTSSTSETTPNVTTTRSADFAYAMCDTGGSGDKPGNGFNPINGVPFTWMSSYFITGAAGAFNFVCNHTAGAGGNDVSLAAFSALAGTGGPIRLPLLGVGGDQ